MISISGMASHALDMDVTTDSATTAYTFSINSFPDGSISLLAVSITTSGTTNCSYLVAVHKHNNIGGKVTVLSNYNYNGLTITFTATYTTVTLTLSSGVTGNLKISPILLNTN